MELPTISPFLSGNWTPVREELTVERLKVIGELPRDLAGSFLRNGPNPQFLPPGQYHLFDGDGMVHNVQIRDGQASYRNRYVRTGKFLAEQEAGRALVGGLLEIGKIPNPDSIPLNTANTSLVWHNQRLLALWEVGPPYELSVSSLETLGTYTFSEQLKTAFTSHPKVDARTGEMLFFAYTMVAPPYLYYGTVSADGSKLKMVPIELPVGVMMHDFAITEHYTIFLDLPLTFRLERMASGNAPFQFEPDRPARFGILPRHGDSTTIRWFERPACWVWHTLNAYEEGDEVVLLACKAQATNLLTAPMMADGTLIESDGDVAHMHRWRFNLSTGSVQEEAIDDQSCEFPRVNDALVGYPTRYGYAVLQPEASLESIGAFHGLVKYDLLSGRFQSHTLKPHQYCGEAVFAPRPSARAEDDGWLLTLSHDYNENRSELLVFDARYLNTSPVARVILPKRVPFGFHGLWIPDA